MKTFISASRAVFQARNYCIIGIGAFLVFFLVNLITFSTPVADESFRAGLLHYADTTIVLRSVLLAALLGILTPFTVYLLRQRTKAHLGASSVGLICSGACCLLGPLCCGAISLLIGWLAGLIPATAAYETRVYAFLGNYESLFFYTSIALLGYALYMNGRKIAAIANCDACIQRLPAQEGTAPDQRHS